MAKDRRTSKEPNNASPSRRVAPNRSNAAGLDPHVERQLILDINAAGGIKQRLTGLVSSRPDIYGEDYSDHQTKVRSRIKYLKDNPRIYSDCLVFQRLVSSTSKAELPSVSPTPKKSNATALSDSKINAITTKITTMTIDDSDTEGVEEDEITVNFERPERNRYFIVFCTSNVRQSNNKEVDVIEIWLKNPDLVDFKNNKYKATVLPPNKVVIEMPLVSGALLKGGDAFFKEVEANDEDEDYQDDEDVVHYCEKQHDNYKVFRNALKKAGPKRNMERIVLKFPSDMQLSNRYYGASNGESENEIKVHCGDFETVTEGHKNEEPIVRTHDVLFWKVSIMGKDERNLADDDEDKAAKQMRVKARMAATRDANRAAMKAAMNAQSTAGNTSSAVPQAEPTLRRSSVALQPARQSSAAHFPGLMDTTTNQEPFVGREIRRLNALVAEYAARLEDAEKSRNQSRATSHTLSSKMDTLLGQAATYRELLAQAEKQQSNAEASFAKTLQERDACSNVEIGQLKEALATSGEKIRHLKEALEASDTKILELENLLGASKQKVDTYRKHLGTAKSEKASAEASLNRMIEQVRLDQESQVAASRNALGEIHRLQQESAALRRQVSEYGGRLDRATREKAEVEASLHDRNQNLLAANSDLSSKLAAVEGDLQRLALVEAGTGQLVAMGQMATNAANQMAMENQVLQSVLAHQQAELQNAVAVANSATGLLAAAAAAAANDANRPPNTEQSIVPRSHSSSQALAICPNEDNGTIVASRKKRKNETGGSFLVQETLILQERSIIQNRYYVQEQPGMEEDPAEVSQPTIEIID